MTNADADFSIDVGNVFVDSWIAPQYQFLQGNLVRFMSAHRGPGDSKNISSEAVTKHQQPLSDITH